MAEADRDVGGHPGNYVEWGAVFAGATTALAVSFVLLTFGAAVGFSAISPWTTSTTTVVSVTIGAVFWMLLSYVWAFSLGGYLSGRMRHRWSQNQTEVDFRDGSHGLLVWASAVTLAAVVTVAGFASADRGTPNGQSAVSLREPMASQLDTLLRTVKPEADARNDDVRPLASRLLIRSVVKPGAAPSQSRVQLVQLVATRTGLSEPDADKRVTESLNDLMLSADRARRLAVLLGFLTAATLLVSAAAAWVAAEIGGKHRDAGTLWAGFKRYSF